MIAITVAQKKGRIVLPFSSRVLSLPFPTKCPLTALSPKCPITALSPQVSSHCLFPQVSYHWLVEVDFEGEGRGGDEGTSKLVLKVIGGEVDHQLKLPA